MAVADPNEIEDFETTVIEAGRKVEDFVLTQAAAVASGSGADRRTVTIEHLKTSCRQTYQAGMGTAWTADFFDDLQKGRFD